MAVFDQARRVDRNGMIRGADQAGAAMPGSSDLASVMPAPALAFEDFMDVVRHTPLVSIDLIIKNSADEALLGLRRNEPAAGYWFVPGGRVLKNETLDSAFARLSEAELGITLSRHEANFYGVWEHFYDSNAGRVAGFGTHYVVLAYQLTLEEDELCLPLAEQHQQYRWVLPEMILTQTDVHHHTRTYFK